MTKIESIPVYVPKKLIEELRAAQRSVDEQRRIEDALRAEKRLAFGGSAEMAKRIARLAEVRRAVTDAIVGVSVDGVRAREVRVAIVDIDHAA